MKRWLLALALLLSGVGLALVLAPVLASGVDGGRPIDAGAPPDAPPISAAPVAPPQADGEDRTVRRVVEAPAAPEQEQEARAPSTKLDLLAAHSYYFDEFLEPMSEAARRRWYGAPDSRLAELPADVREELLIGDVEPSGGLAVDVLYRSWLRMAKELPVGRRPDLLGLTFLEFDEHDRRYRDVWEHCVLLWLYHMEDGWLRIQDKVIQYVLAWTPDGGHRGDPNELLLVLLDGVKHNPSRSHEVLGLLELDSPAGSGRYVFAETFSMSFVAMLAGACSYDDLQRHFEWLRSPERRGSILWGYVELLRFLYVQPGEHAEDFEVSLVPLHILESEYGPARNYSFELLAQIGAPALPLMERLLDEWSERSGASAEDDHYLRKLLQYAAIAGLDPEIIWSYRDHPALGEAVLDALFFQLEDDLVAQRFRERALSTDGDPSERLKAIAYFFARRSDVDTLPEDVQLLAVSSLAPQEASDLTIGALSNLSGSAVPNVSYQAFLGLLGDVGPDKSVDTIVSMATSPHPQNQETGLRALGQIAIQAKGTPFEAEVKGRLSQVIAQLLDLPQPPALLAAFAESPDPAAALVEWLGSATSD